MRLPRPFGARNLPPYLAMVGRASTDIRPHVAVVPATADGGPAQLDLYGPVCESEPPEWLDRGLCLSLEGVLDAIAPLRDADEVTIRLYSTGGDVFAGMAIHDALAELPARKTVVVHGVAASAGSIIAMAGDVVKVMPSTMLMVHNSAALLFDYYTAEDLGTVARSLEACDRSMRAAYAAKSGRSEEELAELMGETTWYVGAEAVEAGFADEVLERDREDEPDEEGEPPAMSADGRFLVVAGVRHPVADMGTLPESVTGPMGGAATATPASQPAGDAPEDTAGGGVAAQTSEEDAGMDIKTTADLRREFPDLAAAIAEEATAAERQRIRDIEEIEGAIGDPAAVARAKYEAPVTAAELTYVAAKASAHAGAEFLSGMAADAAQSGAREVRALPVEEVADTEADEMASALALVKSMFGDRGETL